VASDHFTQAALRAARKRMARAGMTQKEFADSAGVPYQTIKDLLRGQLAGRYGDSHKGAVALGLKKHVPFDPIPVPQQQPEQEVRQ